MDADVEELVTANLPMARIACFRLARRTNHWEDLDDLIGVANEALLEAARSFNPDKGVLFRTWAYRIIGHRIIDFLRAEMRDDGGRGAARGEYFATRVDDTIFLAEDGEEGEALRTIGVEEPGFEELENRLTDRRTLLDFELWALPRLSDRELEVFRTWMQLGRMKATGDVCGITESRVCQIVGDVMDLAHEYGETVLQVA